ncbi:class I SAM-dependent methyltransferase [Nocardioides sp. URHA0032]|uniref:class I SAM-dependent methyltransferase n=1 Tax=Nocardioides sp. URHA0032 TaxID=1380388 RepID=UPI000563467D|nr:methyltransferase [Nocardioides sp. URHA0032]
MENRFEAGTDQWARQLGRLRDAVRQALVATQLDTVVRPPSAVLDVGCGQGTQALRLARLGHTVTGLDLSPELLDRFRGALQDEPDEVRRRVTLVEGAGETAASLGEFDVVLCHGVLMYLDDDDAMLDALVGALAPGGRLSLLVRNGLALAMRPGLLGDWAAVGPALSASGYTNRLGLPARAHTPQQLDEACGARGLRRTHWWGVRVFSDHLPGDAPPGDDIDERVAAELAVSGVDPYRQVAALTHLVYERVYERVYGL